MVVPRWLTSEIAELLENRGQNWAVKVQEPGGDHDTDEIVVRIPSETSGRIFVSGFDPERELSNKSDCAIDLVEVRDGTDSQGGLQSSDIQVALAYAEICTRLRQKGFQVVNSIDDYF